MFDMKSLSISGILIALIPFLGFPGKWETIFFVILGLYVFGRSFYLFRFEANGKQARDEIINSSLRSEAEAIQENIESEEEVEGEDAIESNNNDDDPDEENEGSDSDESEGVDEDDNGNLEEEIKTGENDETDEKDEGGHDEKEKNN